MWCGACQQDVPGVVTSSQDPKLCCARCGQPLARTGCHRPAGFSPHFTLSPPDAAEFLGDHVADHAAADCEGLLEFEELADWDLEETIEHTRQLVSRVAGELTAGSVPPTRQRPPDAGPIGAEQPATSIRPPARPSGLFAWLILSFGLGVFACGAALMGLSIAKDSPPLWQLGLPMVLGGQLAVLFVVIWQLDVVWHSNRATFVALHAMDEQVRQLHLHAAHLRPAAPSDKTLAPHAPAGADPHILLTALRTQLDALATHRDKSKDAA